MTDWGDVPTWISAVTTAGALAAAAWVVVIELRRERRSEEASRSEQAAKVAAWCEHVDYRHPRVYEFSGGGDPEVVGWGLTIHNGSDLPVYEAVVGVAAETSRSLVLVGALPPGYRRVPMPEDVTILDAKYGSASLTVSFRDAAGTRWIRGASGCLHEDSAEARARRVVVPPMEQLHRDHAPRDDESDQ